MSTWTRSSEEEKKRIVNDAIAATATMRTAAVAAGIRYDTFRKYAKKFGVFVPNVGARGTRKRAMSRFPLEEVLDGKHPSYGYGNLKIRLLKSGLKKNACEGEGCGISEWMGKPLTIQMDHRNGDRYDHRLENLRMLCPNCHSQTETYCGRNIAGMVESQTHLP